VVSRSPYLLCINGSSRNCIIHCLVHNSVLNRKGLYLFRVMDRLTVFELNSGCFFIVNWLNNILCVDCVSRHLNVSDNVILLIGCWHNFWVQSSSNFWTLSYFYNFSILSDLRLDVSVVFNGITRDILISANSLINIFNRKSSCVSCDGSWSSSDIVRLCSFSNVKNSVLIIDYLSNRSSIGFSEDFRFSCNVGYLNFRFCRYSSCDHSWSEFNHFGFAFLSFWFDFLLPMGTKLV